MFGPRRHFSFEGTYEMTDEDSVRFGASFMRESLRQSVQSRGTTWYDNNRQDYHLAYEGTHGKNEYDLKVYHNRLGKHSYLGAGTGYNFDRAEYATSAVEGRVTYRADESHTFTYGTEYRHLEAGGTRYGGSVRTVFRAREASPRDIANGARISMLFTVPMNGKSGRNCFLCLVSAGTIMKTLAVSGHRGLD